MGRPVSLIGALAAATFSVSLVGVLILVSPVARGGFSVVHRLLQRGIQAEPARRSRHKGRQLTGLNTRGKPHFQLGCLPHSRMDCRMTAPNSEQRCHKISGNAGLRLHRQAAIQPSGWFKSSRLSKKRVRFPKGATCRLASIPSQAVAKAASVEIGSFPLPQGALSHLRSFPGRVSLVPAGTQGLCNTRRFRSPPHLLSSKIRNI